MKAMIMSDLLIAKKYLLQQLGVSIAVGKIGRAHV